MTTKILKDCSIHGLSDLAKSRSKCERVFWAIALTVAVTIAIVALVRLCLEFRDQPVVSRFGLVQLDFLQLPTMTLCPKTWINRTAVQYLNMSEKQLVVLLNRISAPLPPGKVLPSNQSGLMRELRSLAEKAGLSEPYWLNLAKAIALNGEELISLEFAGTNFKGFGNILRPPRPAFAVSTGLCYTLSWEPIPWSSMSSTVFVLVQVHRSPELLNILQPDDLVLGVDFSEISCTSNSVMRMLSAGKLHGVILSGSKFRRMSTKEKPCSAQINAHDEQVCHMHCLQRAAQQHFNCTPTDFLSCGLDQPSLPHCQINSFQFLNNISKQVDQCQKSCAASCERAIWDVQINTLPDKGNLRKHSTGLIFTIEQPFLVRESQEYYALSLESLIGLIGGHLSLWIGASVLSFLQLLSLGGEGILRRLKPQRQPKPSNPLKQATTKF